MLREIVIKNYTIVDSLHLNLEQGLTVLTGETGAGKSIIVDAVNIGLGARADVKTIRHGETRCDITLCFEIEKMPAAMEWLKAHDFYDQTDCLIRRTLYSDGRSRRTINGHPCPQSLVRELATLILNIHSQHQHQALLKRDAQQQQLDEFGQHQTLLTSLNQAYQTWKTINAEYEALHQQQAAREQQLELLHYQADELRSLELVEDEWHTLHEEQQKLQRAKELIYHLNSAIDLCAENEMNSVLSTLNQVQHYLKGIKNPDAPIQNANALLNSAAIHLQEAADELQQYRDHVDLSPERLHTVEQRLTALQDAARKHHVRADDLPAVLATLEKQILNLTHLDEKLAELKAKQKTALSAYEKIAHQLSEQRHTAAQQLSALLTEQMQVLGMKGGTFSVQLESNTQTPHPLGNEKVIFYVSTNPGQPLQIMSKVVSGGELSRLSLAIQVACAQKENIPTIIFDEVDTGIGGQTAEVVGKCLRQLGERAQVLCITHLAQVAAQGHHQLKVEKQTNNNQTTTHIQPLKKEERIHEIARMLSGHKISDQSRKHAEEMLGPVDNCLPVAKKELIEVKNLPD